MKKQLLFLFILGILSNPLFGQGYEFGIVNITNFDFKIVAIPNFGPADTDISDIGITIMLPAGSNDLINVNGLLGGRPWNITEYDAVFLSGAGLGDGTRDAWRLNLDPGQTLLTHTSGQQIDLVSFTISNSPSSGTMSLLGSNDPIVMGAGGALDVFYNCNIDMTTTQDYYLSIAEGMGDYDFSTLSIEYLEFDKVSIYPNPCKESVNLKGILPLSFRATLYSIDGKVVRQYKGSHKFNVSTIDSGVYFLELFTRDSTKTFKLVKE